MLALLGEETRCLGNDEDTENEQKAWDKLNDDWKLVLNIRCV